MFGSLRFGFVAPLLLSLTACGGGGSESDGTVSLALSPAKIEASSPLCRDSANGLDVRISGGVAPYSIHNPVPEWIGLSTTLVQHSGQSFRVSLVGGACLADIPLQVTDRDANTVEFIVSHKASTSE